MLLKRARAAVLLGLVLALALPVAQARKDDDERGRRDDREQRYEQRRERNDDRYRGPDRERREQRYAPDNAERYRVEPRRYEPPRYEAPRYDPRDYAPQEYSRPQPRYAPRGMSLSEAVSQAERRSGGRVLSAEPGDDGGRPYYRIKVLSPDGRVQILYMDAD